MSRVRTVLASLPDADDVMRRLANVIQAPSSCRRRGCRTVGYCGGGFGPPCFLENRKRFADAVLEEMNEHREHWLKYRASLEALLRR
jgi:hypothetical protein